jgi:hypothetical protein
MATSSRWDRRLAQRHTWSRRDCAHSTTRRRHSSLVAGRETRGLLPEASEQNTGHIPVPRVKHDSRRPAREALPFATSATAGGERPTDPGTALLAAQLGQRFGGPPLPRPNEWRSFGAATFRIVPSLQKPTFSFGAHSLLVTSTMTSTSGSAPATPESTRSTRSRAVATRAPTPPCAFVESRCRQDAMGLGSMACLGACAWFRAPRVLVPRP